MSRQIELPDPVYAALEEAAAAAGITPAEWLAAQLELARTSKPEAMPLPEPVYTALVEAASASGSTPTEWIAARLPEPEPTETGSDGETPRTLADRFEGYLGLVSFETGDMAARASELFADGMVEKHREGRL
jgi:hypothetical protein